MSILERLICSSMVCKYCHESACLIEDQQYSAGLARRFKIQCTSTNCQPKNPKPFSDMTRKSGQFYEINRAFKLASRLIGRGYSAATKMTSVLNLERPVSKKSWKNIHFHRPHLQNSKQLKAWIKASIEAKEYLDKNGQTEVLSGTGLPREIPQIDVSVDGSWGSRG